MTSSSRSSPADVRLTPSRIRLARERRGMSKVTLAATLGVTPRVMHTYESVGAPIPRADDLAGALGVPRAFFTRPECAPFSCHQGFFRSRRRATARQLTAARAAAVLAIEMYEVLASQVKLPEVAMPDLDHQEPESAADTLRALWGRGQGPLPNLVQLGEAHGVRIVSLPTDADTVDAFSLWQDDVPYVFLATSKTGARSRFDLAHELGHLVMHSRVDVGAGEVTSRALEREADMFASALLMPRQDVLSHSGREPAVPEILRLRDHYRVSALAMTRRLHELGRLSDWAYRQNCVQLTQRGFRTGEPGGIQRELSRVFPAVFDLFRREGRAIADVAEELGLSKTDLHSFTFGQLAVALTGGNEAVAPASRSLRLVH